MDECIRNFVTITIKMVRGPEFIFRVNLVEKVSFLKYLIEAESKPEIPFESQILLQRGRILDDELPVAELSKVHPLMLMISSNVEQ